MGLDCYTAKVNSHHSLFSFCPLYQLASPAILLTPPFGRQCPLPLAGTPADLAPEGHSSCTQKPGFHLQRPSGSPCTASPQELSPDFIACKVSFTFFFFFFGKKMWFCFQMMFQMSGSPRSNPSAGKRSNAAILVWHQAAGFLMLPGLLLLLYGKLNQRPKIQRLVSKGYFREERPSAYFPFCLFLSNSTVPRPKLGLLPPGQLNF